LETGARCGELVRVTWADVDFERALLTLRATNTKSRRERSIPLLPVLVSELRALQPEHVAVPRAGPCAGAARVGIGAIWRHIARQVGQ
jgi:integrase